MLKRIATIALFLAFTVPAGGQDEAERQELLERQRRARERIESLEREQGFLLFRKAMSMSDSRYLLLDIRGGRGTLNYRNRALRDFEISHSEKGRTDHRPGMLLLAKKTDGKPRERVLFFGEDLLLRARKSTGRNAGGKRSVSLELAQKDLAAIFFAIETGAPAYILP